MKYYVAPLQGFTNAPFRHFHYELFGKGLDIVYLTPFVRVEKGAPRPSDYRDAVADLDSIHHTIQQVIFANVDELKLLVDSLAEAGCRRINLNMGCPYPMQTAKGRGAATIASQRLLSDIAEVVASYCSDLTFSIKMRLGLKNNDEWERAIDIINSMPLEFVAMHPRIAKQLYSGTVDIEAFDAFCKECRHAIVYNGDILRPGQIENIGAGRNLHGVMAGRGILSRPSLFSEFSSATIKTGPEIANDIILLHNKLFDHYSATLCGDAQLMMKIKSCWEYFGKCEGFDRKALKKLKKATSLRGYLEAMKRLSIIPINTEDR